MKQMRQIGVAIERTSEFGRRFLQGVADFFDDKPECHLMLLNPSQVTDRTLNEHDGWICRITNKRILSKLRDTGKPIVDAICLEPFKGFSTIRTDYTAIGTLAAEHFLAHRFVHFAFCGYRHVTFSDLRRNAFVRVLEDRGFRPSIYRPPYRADTPLPTPTQRRELTEGPLGEIEDADCLTTWLKRLPKPVAIFCCDDFRASAVARLCKRAGIPIPDEVAILGVDNDSLICNFTTPTLSSIHTDVEQGGYMAAELLDERLRNPSLKPRIRMFGPVMAVNRASTSSVRKTNPYVRKGLDYIKDHIGGCLTVPDVARAMGCSERLAELRFREVLGRSIRDEIQDVRLDRVFFYLRCTQRSLGSIANFVGLGDPASLRRFFRQKTGQSPGAWRKKSATGETARA